MPSSGKNEGDVLDDLKNQLKNKDLELENLQDDIKNMDKLINKLRADNEKLRRAGGLNPQLSDDDAPPNTGNGSKAKGEVKKL